MSRYVRGSCLYIYRCRAMTPCPCLDVDVDYVQSFTSSFSSPMCSALLAHQLHLQQDSYNRCQDGPSKSAEYRNKLGSEIKVN